MFKNLYVVIINFFAFNLDNTMYHKFSKTVHFRYLGENNTMINFVT